MTTATVTISLHETWKTDTWDNLESLFPSGALTEEDRQRIPRDELLARVEALGAVVTEHNIKYWEKHRWVPLPQRAGFPANMSILPTTSRGRAERSAPQTAQLRPPKRA
jgi:hypothetical protein